jgi:tripartite-type tricarboxylate transporter receptor subunit TctC
VNELANHRIPSGDAAPTRRQFAIATIGVLLGTVATSRAAAAQSSGGLTQIIVPFTPGSPNDTFARMYMDTLKRSGFATNVVVVNRPGAATITATNVVARARPDGHTMLMTSPALAINASRTDLPYDTADLAPVSMFARLPNVLVVNPQVKASTLQEFIALAKASPGTISYASAGVGSGAHLAAELFSQKAGIVMRHIPYNGNAELLPDLLSNRVQMLISGAVLDQIRSGQLRALGVGDLKRLDTLPDVPTINEAGVPGYDCTSWSGLFVPGKTPPAVIATLNGLVKECLASPQVQSTIRTIGGIADYTTVDEFRTFFAREVATYREVSAHMVSR